MNEDFGTALNEIAEEKGLDKDEILKMIEVSLAAAFRKDYGEKDQNIEVELDPVTMAMKVFDVKTVVDGELEDPQKEISLADANLPAGKAKKKKKSVKAGDISYYSIAASRMIGNKGQVYALDILEESLSQTTSLAKLMGIQNISTKLCDLERLRGCNIDDTSCDVVIAASILHQVENHESILREAYRVLKTGGKILVVEWKKDSPLGPPQNERVSKNDTLGLLERLGFRPVSEPQASQFHYALLYQK